MGHYHDTAKQNHALGRKLRERIPDVYDGFSKTHAAALADGALSGAAKELIALAISVTEGCTGCIISHARGAARQGADPQEVAEALGVAILMQGGPATVYGPMALDAYEEFRVRYT